MTEARRPLKVFLSHASQDKSVVRDLAHRLASEGWIDPWVDEKKLLPGQDWRTKIEEAVETSDTVIICLSNNSISKDGFVQKELRYAREIAFEKPEETIFLIPLRLDDCIVPRGLRFYQWGDYFDEKKEETYTALLESLKLRHEQKLELEEIEYARKEKLEREREAAEKADRERTDAETKEKVRLKAEEQALQKAAREEEKRVVAEKLAREKNEKEIQLKTRQRIKKENRDLEWGKLKTRLHNLLGPACSYAIPGIFLLVVLSMVIYYSKYFPIFNQNPTFTPQPSQALTEAFLPAEIFTPNTTPNVTLSAATPLPTEITDNNGVEMVLIPAGEFVMGYKYSSDAPIHTVYLESFYIDKYEVTNDLYQICVTEGYCTDTGDVNLRDYSYKDYPVVWVSWNKAQNYCEWREARLPTESEWEKAARGVDQRLFPWGDQDDESFSNSGRTGGWAVVVGSYQNDKSPYGVYDMAGNVQEWVNDGYDVYPGGDPAGSPYFNQKYKVLRGGAWYSFSIYTYKRYYYSPFESGNSIGFRCAKNANP